MAGRLRPGGGRVHHPSGWFRDTIFGGARPRPTNLQPAPNFAGRAPTGAPYVRLQLPLSCYVSCEDKPSAETPACNLFDAIVKSDPIIPDDQGGRVLRFRPRGTLPGSPPRGNLRWPPDQDSPVDDLAKYERHETSDDYRHRMTMNLLTLAFAAMLIACGVWLTTKLVENRNLQDCFLSGRRNCAPIAVPSRSQE
jgi:hypothetical protein